VPVDALKALATAPFPVGDEGWRSAIVSTAGTEDGTIIMRGGKTPNYDAEQRQRAACATRQGRLAARLMSERDTRNYERRNTEA